MYLQGGDFDIEDRVSASEGEQVVTGVAFGNYDEEVYGEAESYDVMSVGDFDDSDLGFGFIGKKQSRFMKKVKKHTALPAAKKGLPVNTGVPRIGGGIKSVPKINSPIRTSVPAVNRGFPGTPKVVSQGKHLGWGKKGGIKTKLPSPAAISAAAKKIVHTKVQAAKNTIVARALNKGGGVQSVQAVTKRTPSVSSGVVSSAGTALTASNLEVPTEVLMSVKSYNPYAHPLVSSAGASGLGEEYDAAIGEYEAAMGLDFKKLWSKAQTQIKTAVKEGGAKLLASGKTIFGEKLSAAGAKVLATPEVKAFAVEQADVAATNKVAEALRDPTNRKIAAGVAVVLLGLYAKKTAGKFLWLI